MPNPYHDDSRHWSRIPAEGSDSARGDQDDTLEAELDKLRGNLRPPAHIWMAIMIGVAAFTVLTAVMLFAPH